MFFVTKEWQYRKQSLSFLLAFKQSVWPFSGLFLALFGFLLKFSSGNHGGPRVGKPAARVNI